MTWATLLEDRFAIRISQEKALRWESILNAKRPAGMAANTSNQELCNLVLWLAANKRANIGGEHTAITVDRLFGWLCWYRKERRQEREGEPVDFMQRMQRAIHKASTHEMVWNVIVHPMRYAPGAPRDTSVEECENLIAFAEKNGLLPEGYSPKFALEAIDVAMAAMQHLPEGKDIYSDAF